MKSVLLIIFTLVLNSCATIIGGNYHSIEGDDADYKECLANVFQPNYHIYSAISGRTNQKTITRNGNYVVICSIDGNRYTGYVSGPLIPFIPMFGFNDDAMPEYVGFLISNKSTDKSIAASINSQFEYCSIDNENPIYCKPEKQSKSSLDINPNSSLMVNVRYSEKILISIKFEDGTTEDIQFMDERGLFYILTT